MTNLPDSGIHDRIGKVAFKEAEDKSQNAYNELIKLLKAKESAGSLVR